MAVSYLDPRTGETFPLDQPRWCGTDQRPLLLMPLPGITRADIDTGTRSLWRYRAALPLAGGEIRSAWARAARRCSPAACTTPTSC